MIPKVIHYCWFGGNPLPEDAKKYIETWKKYCPDYEIKEWNESNFDVSCCAYVKEAHEAKKWAFVSDYARFAILYKYGGVYFDTDVEIIKPIDDILAKGPFMGLERNEPCCVAPGLGLAANPGLGLYKEILDFYKKKHFRKENGKLDITTVVDYTTEILKKHGLKPILGVQYVAGVYIYPVEYFSPMDVETRELKITNNTYTIHHYAASWYSPWQKFKHSVKMKLMNIFGSKVVLFLKKILRNSKY